MKRAYALFEVKSIDEKARTFTGIASTPTTDRMEDIVEPMGAIIRGLPDLPLMWQHALHSMKDPIGWVRKASPNKNEIPMMAEMATPKDDYPPSLIDDLQRAWVLVRDKLVRGLSIGFNPLEWEPIKGTFGVRYTKWELLEISACAIAANQEATILTIKQLDTQTRAALGLTRKGIPLLVTSPGASGTRVAHSGAVKLIPR